MRRRICMNLKSTDFFKNVDPNREKYEIAIKYAEGRNVNIYDINEVKKLYEDVNKRIEEICNTLDNNKDDELVTELENLNEVFYGLVGLIIDNKNASMNKA